MIKSISLKNFRSFGDSGAEFDIKPINLIFGANSSGKSSIMKALLLVKGAFYSGNFDIFKLDGLNEDVDMGGIDNMIHRKDFARDIEIGISFDSEIEYPSSVDSIKNAKVEFKIGKDKPWNGEKSTKGLKKINIYLESEQIITFSGEYMPGLTHSTEGVGRVISIVDLNTDHEFIKSDIRRFKEYVIRFVNESPVESDQVFKADVDEFANFIIMQTCISEDSILTGRGFRDYLWFKIQGEWDGLRQTQLERSEILLVAFMKNFFSSEEISRMPELHYGFGEYENVTKLHPSFNYKDGDVHDIMSDNYDFLSAIIGKSVVREEYSRLSPIVNAVIVLQEAIYSFAEQIFGNLSRSLQDLSYLGPIRTIPDRIKGLDKTNNSDELRSWNALKSEEQTRDKVNRWLNKKLRLNYKIVVLDFYSGPDLKKYVEHELFNSMIEDFPLLSGAIVRHLRKEGVAEKRIARALQSLKESIEEGGDEFLPDQLVEKPNAFKNVFGTVDPIKAAEGYSNPNGPEVGVKEERSNYLFQEYYSMRDRKTPEPNIKELAVIDTQFNTHVGFQDIGVGLSQVLPIIVSAISKNGRTTLIEQPELHVHPGLQSEIGDLFIESFNENKNKIFIVETHSEHLILRILRRIREMTRNEPESDSLNLRKEDLNVSYVSVEKEGSVITKVSITDDGDFEGYWPPGFFADRSRELF